ncbi:hypothetical protein [Nocardia terpenica]|uniref:hypothetical protein n=1 Tax=Nocardia terpenica TaxID=455432 RepID=UPI00031F37A5|nr:hypothetical protein [Nocardia terpenica]NQE89566.1 hypothetical protein [Nocardia terpenica]
MKFTLVRIGENPYQSDDRRVFVISATDDDGDQYGVLTGAPYIECGPFRAIRDAVVVELPEVEKTPGTAIWRIKNGPDGGPRVPENDLDQMIEVGRAAIAVKIALGKARSPEQLTSDLNRLLGLTYLDPGNVDARGRLRAALAEGRVRFE